MKTMLLAFTMLGSQFSAVHEEFLAQVPAPCGSKGNPCYVRADVPILVQWSEERGVGPELNNCQETKGLLVVGDCLLLGMLALVLVGTRQRVLDAWVRSEFKLPIVLKQLAYVFLTPVLGAAVGGLFVRMGSWFASALAPELAYWALMSLFGVVGAVLGFGFAVDLDSKK